MLNVKDLISDGKRAHFKQFRQNTFYYEIEGSNFIFAVPLAEVGDALLQADERASMFMKWIKRAVDEINTEN